MAMAPSITSTQYSIFVNFETSVQAGTLVHFQTSDENKIYTFKPARRYQSRVFSSHMLMKGALYEIYLEGNLTGIVENGIYIDGTYMLGNKYASITISRIVTGAQF